jgi:glycosyltransferase involved in cell wall biosynthesis
MINVCVVNPNYYRSSGVTVAIRRIFESLPDADVTQYFVDCGYGDEEPDTSWIPKNRLATFRLMTSSPVALARECAAFLRWLKTNDIRVVHVHHRRLAVILGWLQVFLDYKLIYTGNLTYRYEFWFWLFSPRIATGITQSVIENLKRTTRTKQIHLIGNGCDFPAVCPPVDVARVCDTAICIARLDPVKGHDNLLDAWRILIDRGRQCRLLLVGEGQLRQALERRAAVLGIGHAVEFRGFQRDVIPQIEQALFAVLPSRVEGQGIVTIEAAARGRASLVTDVDGSRDCVPAHHVLPNLVKFGDVAGLADALEAWFAQPVSAVSEGRAFFDYLKSSSSTASVGKEYCALYEQVAKSAGDRRSAARKVT